VKPKKKVMEAESVDGNFHDGSVWNHGRSTHRDGFFLLDHALPVAIHTREEPITPGAATLGTTIKYRETDRDHLGSGSFLSWKNNLDV
jgi:hypothetical protein